MDVKVEKQAKGKIKLIFVIEPMEMVGYFNRSYSKIAPTIKLSGFRPGKAPRKLVESAAGVSRLLSEALDSAVSNSYSRAIAENKIIPITSPNIVINKYPTYGSSLEEVQGNFEFEAELEALPEVILKDYSKVKVKKGETKVAKKEDVDKVIEHFRKQNASFTETDSAAEKGDRAEISFEGFVKGVRIDQMCSKNHPVILGDNTLIPGFEDEIVGLKKGDKKEFKITFPKDYHAKEYAGKAAEFKVEVNDLKKIELPELDNKFAEMFGHKDLTLLNKAIEKSLNMEMAEEYQRDLEGRVVDAVLPYLQAEIPDTLIDREAEKMIADFGGQLQSQGLNLDMYLKNIKKTKEDMKKDMLPNAEKNVKVGLLLGKIIEQNKWDQNSENIGKKAIDFLIEKTVG